MCDTYNGWTNRETWALVLWLDNDYGLYTTVRELVSEAKANYIPEFEFSSSEFTDYMAGDVVSEFWDELTDLDYIIEMGANLSEIYTMVADVGSVYRVNWVEVGAHYLSELAS